MGDRLAGVIGGIIKTCGESSVKRAEDCQDWRRISTGSTALDAALGANARGEGGIVVGQATVLWGERSGGKTTVVLLSIANAQKLCRRCLRPAKNLRVIDPASGEVFTPETVPDVVAEVEGEVVDEEPADELAASEPEDEESEVEAVEVEAEEDPEPEQKKGRGKGKKGKGKRGKKGKDADSAPAPDANIRWYADAECDCIAQGLVPMPPPPPKLKGEKPTEWKVRVEAWSAALMANSYEEYICALVDTEGAFDKLWARTLGVDTNRLVYSRPMTGEEAADILGMLAGSTMVDFIGVDSIAMLVPSEDFEGSSTQANVGLQARVVSKSIKKLAVGSSKTARLADSGWGLTQIWTNQIRMKIGVMFGDPSTRPGGLAPDFTAKTEVRFFTPEFDTINDKITEKDQITKVAEQTFKFKITRNNTAATTKSEGTFTLCMRNTDVHRIGTVIEDHYFFTRAEYLGLIVKKAGAGYIFLGNTYKTQDDVKQAIRSDPDVIAALRKLIFERIVRGEAA